jgi:hypothetical protein
VQSVVPRKPRDGVPVRSQRGVLLVGDQPLVMERPALVPDEVAETGGG